MFRPVTVADTYGDEVTVSASARKVYLDTSEEHAGATELALTPKAARKLAKALKRAARTIEAGEIGALE